MGTAALAPVVLLGSLWAGSRIVHALVPTAVDRASPVVLVSPRSPSQLSDAIVPDGAEFTGPDRPATVTATDPGTTRTWHAFGRWWALMERPGDGALTIWGLSARGGPWVDTGVVADERGYARPAVAWNGNVLVVASVGPKTYQGHALRTNRFQWDGDTRTWGQLPDFPVTVTEEGGPSVSAGLASDGRVWLARMVDDHLELAHSSTSGLEHTSFAPLPDGVAGADVGGYSLAVSGTTVQVAWRSISSDSMGVATSTGDRWDSQVYPVFGISGPGPVDAAHADPANPGELLVAVRTSLGARGSNDQDPGVLLVAIRGGQARIATASRLKDGLGDPSVVVDPAVGSVAVVAKVSTPATASGQEPTVRMVEKVSSIKDLSFAPGSGTTLLTAAPGLRLGAAIVPANAIEVDAGLLVLATEADPPRWRTAQVGGLDPTGSVSRRSGAVDVVHDTFDDLPLGGAPPAAWYPGTSADLQAEVIEASGASGRGLRISNVDGGDASLACRSIPSGRSGPVTVRVEVVPVLGATAKDARLLTVRGPGGSLVSVRLSKRGEVGWSGASGRVVAGSVALGVPLRVSVEVDPASRRASVNVEAGGVAAVQALSVALLDTGEPTPDEICFGPGGDDAGASLVVSDVVVRRR